MSRKNDGRRTPRTRAHADLNEIIEKKEWRNFFFLTLRGTELLKRAKGVAHPRFFAFPWPRRVLDLPLPSFLLARTLICRRKSTRFRALYGLSLSALSKNRSAAVNQNIRRNEGLLFEDRKFVKVQEPFPFNQQTSSRSRLETREPGKN